MAAPRPQIITEANATSPQIIDGSVRFIRNQKTYLERTPSIASNRKTWTLSLWVKMGEFNIRESDGTWNRGAFLSSGTNPWGGPTVWSDATNRNFAHAYDPSGTDYSKRCISNCRDFSSWYHVVYTTDTAQSTDTNRWKIYVNGELQDLETPSGLNGYPSQNTELGINAAVQHYLGVFNNASAYFDGYISEYHFIDGQVLGPENFGYLDSLTNTWRPKKFSWDSPGGSASFLATLSATPFPYSGVSSGNATNTGSVDAVSAGSNDFNITTAAQFDESAGNGIGNAQGLTIANSVELGDEYTLDYYANQVGTQNDQNGTVITIREGSSGTMFLRDYNDNGQRKLNIGSATYDYGGGSWTGSRDWWHIRVTNTGFWYNGTLITGAVDSLSGYGDGGDGLTLYIGNYTGMTNSYRHEGLIGPIRIVNRNLGAPPSGGLPTTAGSLPVSDIKGTIGGINSFYLPFDGKTPIGEDQSGKGNDWTPVNFSSSSGGSCGPILHTINGGNVASVGVAGRTGVAVTVYNSGSGNKYYLDGVEAGTLSFVPGQNITFDTSNSTVSGHPFRLSSKSGGTHGTTDYSVDFDGTGDYLSIGSHADTTLGSVDFTMECWVYFTGSGTYVFFENNTGTGGCSLQINGSNQFSVQIGSTNITSPSALATSTWHHLCVQRDHSASKTNIYVNGSIVNTTATDSGNSTNAVTIGGRSGGSFTTTGKISNVRLVKGSLVYNFGGFTPPSSPLTNVTNTKLLCCQSSAVTTSVVSSGGAITANGDPTVSTDTPYDTYPFGTVTGASEGSAGAATTIILPHNAPSNLYYYCTAHSGMGGTLDIGNIDTSIADPYALDCYFALPLFGGNPEDVSHQVNWKAAKKTASTASNLAVSQRSVLYNNSTYFNGSSSEIKYSIASELDFASKDFTVEMWFYTRNLTGEHHYPLIQKGNASNNNNYDWRLYFSGTGSDEYIYWDTAGGGPSLTGPVVPETYRWYHVAVCKDNTNIRMYFNGEQMVTASWSGGDVDDAYTEVCLGHANHGGAGDTWLDGEISDARVYVGRAKYTSDFTPDSSKLPAIVKDTPSGVLYSSKLEKPEYGAVTFGQEAGYMTVVEDADWDFGTGDYTAEAWVYMTGTDNYVFATLISGSWWGLNFWTNNSSWSIRAGYNSKHEYTGIRWNYRRWYHIAVARESGTSRLFLDGELIDTQSDSDNLDSTGALQIGRDANSWNKKFSGLISNARIVKGTAVYTHSFVPSRKPLTNITNTKLLCCQSNTSATTAAVVPDTGTGTALLNAPLSSTPFADSSSTGATITNTGSIATASAGTNSFNITNAASLDGSSQRLGTNNTNMSFTGNWTLDAWFKLDSSASGYNALFNTGYGSQNTYMYFSINDDEKPYIEGGSAGGTSTAANAINKNQWYHMRVRCHGSNILQYIDGTLVATHGNNTTDMSSLGTKTIGSLLDNGNNANNFHGLIGPVRYVSSDLGPPPVGGLPTTSGALSNTPVIPALNEGTSDTIASSFNPFEDNINLVRGQQTGYCTLNNGFWDTGGGYTFNEGNLVLGKTSDGGWDAVFGTVSFPPTGKWQWEFSPEPKGSGEYPYNVKIGWMPESKTHSMSQNQMGTAGVLVYDVHTSGACKYQLDTGSQTSYGAAIQTPGAVITLGLDFDNKVAKFALDGVARAELDISSSSLLTSGNLIPCLIGYYGDAVHFWKFNFGQKPFTFSFGEDYKTICVANSEEPALARPDKYFTTFAYNGSSATTFRKLGLEADLVWIKSNYDNVGGWNCLDTVRGASQTVQLNTNAAQTNETGNFVSFDKEGVTVTGSANAWNGTGDKFVIYAWAAGGSKGTFNKDGNAYSTAATAGLTAGDITPTGCSINTKTGFSIIQYTAAGNGDRVPHGLTQTPDLLITKVVSSPSDDWSVYTTVVDGSYDYFVLNGTNAKTDSGQTAFNATTFPNVWGSGKTVINYAWHNVPGVQKFGLCYGNNDADGLPVYLGFEPAMIILKEASQTSAWTTKCNNAFDNVYATTLNHKYTGTYNPVGNQMYLNTTAIDEAKSAAYGKVDFLSNGFRARVAGQSVNSNTSYIFMAFAAKPYHNLYGGDANAR